LRASGEKPAKPPIAGHRQGVARAIFSSVAILVMTSSVPSSDAEIVEIRRIWDRADHNAFTDLIRHRERWICVFREGTTHVSPDGIVRVLSSGDGALWSSLSRISLNGADLRDPKICLAPDGRLMLTSAAAYPAPSEVRHQTMVWFSVDGTSWAGPEKIGEPNVWLWRVTWHKGTAYGVGYDTPRGNLVRLYSSRDGRRFTTLVDPLHPPPYSFECLQGIDGLCDGYVESECTADGTECILPIERTGNLQVKIIFFFFCFLGCGHSSIFVITI